MCLARKQCGLQYAAKRQTDRYEVGFKPIGGDDINQGHEVFRGIFEGNNYKITNLYENGPFAGGLFSICFRAHIQDMTLVNPTIIGEYFAGSLATLAVATPINNVHVINGVVSANSLSGGLAGALFRDDGADGILTSSRNSFAGVVNTIGQAGEVRSNGGLFGVVLDTNVTNSYAQADIHSDQTTAVGGLIGLLLIYRGASVTIANNYSTGTVTSGIPAFIGGLIGAMAIGSDGYVQNNFSDTVVNAPDGPTGPPAGLLNNVSDGQPYIDQFKLSNNYYNKSTSGLECGYQVTAGCIGITGQPNYFKNNSTNPPLNAWDFTNIWNVTPTYPEFNKSVLTSVSSTPGTSGSTGSYCLPSIFKTNPCPSPAPAAQGGYKVVAKLVSAGSGETGSTTPSDELGVLGAIKHFVRSLPAVVVVAFPYLLYGLLMLAVLLLIIELIRELRRAHILEALINKQRLLAEERDAFWHLAANYLRAPVTLIVGGAEALSERNKNKDTVAISTLASSLKTKVSEIMKKIEESTSPDLHSGGHHLLLDPKLPDRQ